MTVDWSLNLHMVYLSVARLDAYWDCTEYLDTEMASLMNVLIYVWCGAGLLSFVEDTTLRLGHPYCADCQCCAVFS